MAIKRLRFLKRQTLIHSPFPRILSLPHEFLLSSPRTYHSTSHPPPPSPFPSSSATTKILTAATPHIPTHGFTLETLSLGAIDSGYLPASTNLFPRGPFDLVLFWLWRNRTGLSSHTDRIFEGKREMGVGKKVQLLTWERLMGNKEIIGRWQEALALMATPANIVPSFKELAKLSDEIFYLAGDVSVDSSWYTKRASLSGIYAATELFMTTDQSTDFRDTRQFMERRFGDGMVVGKTVGGLGQWVGFTASAAVNVARSRGVRI